MKTIFSLVSTMLFMISCNDNSASISKDNAADTSRTEYAYIIDHPDYWETGSKENTQKVLNGLKAFEEGDINKAVKDFADTVKLEFDHFEKVVSKDSLIALFTRDRGALKSFKIIMDDFESVRSKDGKREFVSLWYKQIWQDSKGVTDSLECMDDFELKNGKIVYFNEKNRHFAEKKK